VTAGVAEVLRNGAASVVMLRSDMVAQPIAESGFVI
jgi:hypothetical protein